MQEIGSLLCVISLSVQCFFSEYGFFFINKVYSLGHTRKGKIPKNERGNNIINQSAKREKKNTHRENTATNVINTFIHFNSNLKAQMRVVHLSFWREKCWATSVCVCLNIVNNERICIGERESMWISDFKFHKLHAENKLSLIEDFVVIFLPAWSQVNQITISIGIRLRIKALGGCAKHSRRTINRVRVWVCIFLKWLCNQVNHCKPKIKHMNKEQVHCCLLSHNGNGIFIWSQ